MPAYTKPDGQTRFGSHCCVLIAQRLAQAVEYNCHSRRRSTAGCRSKRASRTCRPARWNCDGAAPRRTLCVARVRKATCLTWRSPMQGQPITATAPIRTNVDSPLTTAPSSSPTRCSAIAPRHLSRDRRHARAHQLPAAVMFARAGSSAPRALRSCSRQGRRWRVATQLFPTAIRSSSPRRTSLFDGYPTDFSSVHAREFTVDDGQKRSDRRRHFGLR